MLRATARAALILFIVTGSSGCATAITQGLRESARSPGQEIDSDGSWLDARYLGESMIDDFTVARIIVTTARKECSDRPPVEMLVPLTRRQSARPRLLEARSASGKEGAPVRIINDHTPFWLTNENDGPPRWEGYPSLMRLQDMGEAAPQLYYRFGPGERDLRHEDVDLELDWICRSRMAYAAYTALLPAAVALDVATFPLQLLGVILAGH